LPSASNDFLSLVCRAFIAITVLVEIARLVAGVIMMLPRDFLLSSLISMAMLIEVTGLVAGMVVMLTRLLLRHRFNSK